MPAVTIQFHMLFEELVAFVAEMRTRHNLGIELERWFPNKAHEVPQDADLAKEVRRFGHVDRIWLLCKPPRHRKIQRFMLNVGNLKGNRLNQAHLGAGTDNLEAFKVLKKVARDLKKRTTAGIWVIGATGVVGYDKISRTSPGAAKASRAGDIELVQFGTTGSFSVDPPER